MNIKLTKDYFIEGQIIEAGTNITIEEDSTFDYQLLGRLQADVEYYITTGAEHWWASSPQEQAEKMKELYARLPESPQWMSKADLDNYVTILMNID